MSYRSGRRGIRPLPSGKGLAGDVFDKTKTVDRHFWLDTASYISTLEKIKYEDS